MFRFGVLIWILLLSGCQSPRGLLTTLGPDYKPTSVSTPKEWQVPPLPHSGSVASLKDWWSQFRDPLLISFISEAQAVSSNVADAQALIVRARANAVVAEAKPVPALNLTADANRSAFSFGGPVTYRSLTSIGLQSSWEIDLFGGLAREREAALAALQSAQANWHAARVAIAVEVATAYFNYRYCQTQIILLQQERDAQERIVQSLTEAVKVGLQPAAVASLAQAKLAELQRTLTARATDCDVAIKGLVALTAQDEPTLRRQLAVQLPVATVAQLPAPPTFVLPTLPAELLNQRPDLFMAERAVAQASAAIGIESARWYPRLSLTGSITPTRQSINDGPVSNVRTWSVGPSLLLPLIQGGRRSANLAAAQAEYEAAKAAYVSKARQAVREVEEAMLRVQSAQQESAYLVQAYQAVQENMTAVTTREQAGFANRIELQDARRSLLQAEQAWLQVKHEQINAWVSLYRALGGGWQQDSLALNTDYRLSSSAPRTPQ
ncbi:efflux transporter outer membrane subunit [Parvibium lacunae]|uniref:Transporter n=1 Tax=Parvibium lacunae TaxID=1888893 RepID=A0A368L797_9BURK|nr:efflux transporter outer membrane subunit [Parvibium lacunae]RCS59381.1 transporter [Parvibium lacunae]